MQVTLIGKNSMHKIILPQTVVGNYWISDKNGENEKKLVNIEGKDGKWQIVSNNYVKVINTRCVKISNDGIEVAQSDETIIKRIALKENSMYCIAIGNSEDLFILSCAPVFKNNFFHLGIKGTSEILIGNGTHNHISYNNVLVNSTHARIFFDNGVWMIENFDSKFGTFVNNKPVSNEAQILSNGDVIFIMELKIIIMGNEIFINNPLNKVSYITNNFDVIDIKNEIKKDTLQFKMLDDDNFELYEEDDYFSKAPRITNIIECEKVKIDEPPQIQSKEEMPLALVLGSTLTMGGVMLISMVSSIDGLISGTASLKTTFLSLFMSLAMLVGMILFPILNVKYEKRQKVKYEEKRQQRYKDYIDSKIDVIDKIMNKQRTILFDNYVSVEECEKIILNREHRLWERKIEDYDFLTVRLGIGDVPLSIDIQYPEEKFTMDDDNLIEILNTVANKSKILQDAPIVMSLVEKNISALIVQDDEKMQKFMRNLIMQLIAFHSYEDLKLVFLLKEDHENEWDYIKMLPHVWNNTKQIRFFANDYDDMKEISRYLEEDLQHRLQYEENNVDYKSFMPYYLIITDDYKKIENLKIITEVLKAKINFGFSILCITNNIMQLPNECKTFIDINNSVGNIFESEMSSKNQKQFKLEEYQTPFLDQITRTISNIPIKYTLSNKMMLPNKYTFLEMYDVGCIEQLNILERWKNNDSTLSLKAPVGIDGTGMPIVLDIHEKFHGPHGLIAGSTGSGKSEFIITYILSLAINYHPDDVTFMLIDYKGGGLAGAFKKREIKLPHLVGTITNIDTVGLQRSLDSIQSELRRRQIIFNEARNMVDESTIDIYKYQSLYHDGIVDKPVPHLLIICDEFAELKQQQEEFMDELISVARIGRSLGVHLILATQKPAGIVNDQIRSNSKFGVCLKVQDKEDSNDVIKKPDAAFLKKTGQFYLQVGNDEYFVLGQSAWSGAPYFPSNVIKKKVDNSIEFISDIGTVIKRVDDSLQKIVSSSGDQLTNIVRYLYELAKQENITVNQLWLDNIPDTIFVKELRKKYNVKTQKNIINPIIGEYDDPLNQRQGIVNLSLSNGGNTIIYGNAESGKETLLSTIVYDTITQYTSDEVQLYLLDFGSEVLKIFKAAPHVGDVVFINDNEKLSRFFNMIQKEIRDRKSILSEYNGDYNLYLNTSGKSMPMTVVIMNNYEAFAEIYEDDYDDILQSVTREGIKYGIVFIITTTTPNNLRYRLSQNFKQKIALQLNNEDDYLNIFDKLGKKRPSHIFGRGLVNLEDGGIYEFQTAKICNPENWNLYIKETIEKLKESNTTVAQHIPVIPDKVALEDLKEYLKDISAVPIGIIKKNLSVFTYDFKKNFMNIITSKNIEDSVRFTSHILEEIKQLNDVNIIVFDSERILQNKKNNFTSTYEKFISELNENSEKNNSKYSVCIILGLDKFINELEDEESEFLRILKKAQDIGNYSFIVVENATRLKNHEYDEWYKDYIMGDSGIWIGNGVDDQYLINVSSNRSEIVNNCGYSFGYVIKEGVPILIKLLGIKDKGDDDE